ncbi:MAG: Uma2 family endonuclease, partial [Planctomycetota bacterium]
LDHTTVAEQDIKTSSGVRRGDRVVWCGLGRTPKLADVPTIAVEIVSKDKRDRHRDFVEKRREYLQAGVREYWIFDPFRRTLTVCTTAEGDAGRKVVKATGTYRTALLPGFELSIAELLAEADAVGG